MNSTVPSVETPNRVATSRSRRCGGLRVDVRAAVDVRRQAGVGPLLASSPPWPSAGCTSPLPAAPAGWMRPAASCVRPEGRCAAGRLIVAFAPSQTAQPIRPPMPTSQPIPPSVTGPELAQGGTAGRGLALGLLEEGDDRLLVLRRHACCRRRRASTGVRSAWPRRCGGARRPVSEGAYLPWVSAPPAPAKLWHMAQLVRKISPPSARRRRSCRAAPRPGWPGRGRARRRRPPGRRSPAR